MTAATARANIAHDDATRRYSYELVRGPMPVSRYRATLAVKDAQGGTARVRWSAEFTPAGTAEADAEAAIGGFLHAGLDNPWPLGSRATARGSTTSCCSSGWWRTSMTPHIRLLSLMVGQRIPPGKDSGSVFYGG